MSQHIQKPTSKTYFEVLDDHLLMVVVGQLSIGDQISLWKATRCERLGQKIKSIIHLDSLETMNMNMNVIQENTLSSYVMLFSHQC